MNNVGEYVIRQGDTLQFIAQKVLGDASKAFEIAIANKLEYPFISDQGNPPTVKSPGDVLIIPYNDLIYGGIDDIELAVFGSDLVLQALPEGTMRYSGGQFITNNQNDLGTVQGVGSLEQDLIHRLITELGSLVYHPEYGSDLLRIIGNKRDTNWKDKAVIELTRAIRCDDRVIDVKSVEIKNIDTGIHLSCVIITPNLEILLSENIGGE